jgi:phosphoenolpyruvate carboxylase
LDQLDALIIKVNLFGFHFASLDIRQNSKIHDEVLRMFSIFYINSSSEVFLYYYDLTEEEKFDVLSKVKLKCS